MRARVGLIDYHHCQSNNIIILSICFVMATRIRSLRRLASQPASQPACSP
jgi:hypothetical protein